MATLTLDCTLAAQECLDDPHESAKTVEPSWEDLYRLLTVYIRSHIYNSGIVSWYGQEQDLVEDIVQEAICRTHAYLQKVQLAQAPAIFSMYHFSKAIAFRYFQDLRRKDRRLIHPAQIPSYEEKTIDTIEVLLEEMSLEAILNHAACIIADLPKKQRQAVLRDLANRLANAPGDESNQKEQDEDYLELIERAFLGVDIQLADYQLSLPLDRMERSRHASSLSIAYHKLYQLYHASSDLT